MVDLLSKEKGDVIPLAWSKIKTKHASPPLPSATRRGAHLALQQKFFADTACAVVRVSPTCPARLRRGACCVRNRNWLVSCLDSMPLPAAASIGPEGAGKAYCLHVRQLAPFFSFSSISLPRRRSRSFGIAWDFDVVANHNLHLLLSRNEGVALIGMRVAN